MSDKRPNVVVVSAPSGAGKSTVLARALAHLTGIRFSVSHTTRPPRAGEAEGVEYHYMERQAFEAMIQKGLFMEWAEVHGHLYGTSQAEYERAQRAGQDLLLDLDVQGARLVCKKFEDAVTIFILPPSYRDLEMRIRGRGLDDEVSIQKRLVAAREEMSRYTEYDYALVNDEIDRCAQALEWIIEAARRRTSRMRSSAEAILRTFESR